MTDAIKKADCSLHTPVDNPDSCTIRGNPAEAEKYIDLCYPRFWCDCRYDIPREINDEDILKASVYFRLCIGDLPYQCDKPTEPVYLSPELFSESTAIHWCRVNGYDLYELEHAGRVTLATVGRGDIDLLHQARADYTRLMALERNPNETRLTYSPSRLPSQAEFWQQLGHHPFDAEAIAKCYPEYWLRPDIDWTLARGWADGRLNEELKWEGLTNSRWWGFGSHPGNYLIDRNPINWCREGFDLEQATEKAVQAAGVSLPAGYDAVVRRRREIYNLPRQAKFVSPDTIFVSGSELPSPSALQADQAKRQEAQAESARKNKRNPPNWPRWGALRLDNRADATAHCCAVGVDSHGKLNLLRIYMTSVAHARWLIYGGNSSLLPAVKGIRPKAEIHNLNPFDRRASAWDIPADAQTPGQVRQIAAAFIRDNQDETQYAVEAQRALVAAAIEALHTKSSSNWGLSHLLAALRPEAIEPVLCEYSTTREVYENYLGRYSPDDAAELLALLQSKLQPFYPIAAAWQHTRKHMSLRSWANSHDILVLGNDKNHRQMLAPLNCFLSWLIADILLGDSSSGRGRTYIFLPYLEQIHPVEPLQVLLADGPAADVTLYLGMRDIRALHRQYGPDAIGILELCGNLAIFRITHQATACWASGQIGNQRVIVLKDDGDAHIRRPAASPSQLRNLPLADADYALPGYLKNQSMPFYKADTLCDARGLERLFPASDINFPNFLPRPDFHCESSDDGNLLLAELGFTSFGVSSTVQPSPQPSRPLNQQMPPPQPAASPPAGGPTQQPPRSPSQTTASNSPPQQPQNARPFDPYEFRRVDFGN